MADLGRRYWILWSAFSSANFGDGVSLVAFPLLAVGLTNDARLVALVALFRFLPFIVFGLPAGLILDRFDRRRIAIAAQIVRGGVLGALALVVLGGGASIAALSVAGFVVGSGEVLTDGGLPAIVRDLVRPEQLEVANSRLSASQTATNAFIGPPLGALAFGIDPAAPLLISALAFVSAAAALVTLPGRFRPLVASSDDSSSPSLLAELTVGLRYVWGHPVLRPLAATVAVFSFAGSAGNTVFVILATERLGLGPLGFGLLISLSAVASVTMSFFVARLVVKLGHAGSMRLAVVTFTVGAVLLGTTTFVAVAAVAMVVVGVSQPAWDVVSSTIRQRLVPDEVFGRMMTAYLFIAWGLQPAGVMVGGFVAEAWGPQWVYVGSGALVGSLLLIGRPLFVQVTRSMAPVEGPGSV